MGVENIKTVTGYPVGAKYVSSAVSIVKSVTGYSLEEGSVAFLLDKFPGAAVAYSLNKLSSTYTGYAIRVRRSSDNAEQDISFGSDGKFDSITYLSFIGVGNGFCTTMYDQSGGGRNLTQATAGSQPQIVLQDGEYVLRPTGGRFLQNSSFVGSQGGTFTFHISWKAPGNPPTGFASQVPGLDWAASTNFLSPWWTTVQHGSVYSNNVATTSQAGWEDGHWRQMVMKYASSNVSLFEYGTQIMAPIARVEPSWGRLTVGKNDFGNGDFYFNEIALWPSSVDVQLLFENYKGNHPTLLASNSDELFVNIGDSLTTTLYCGLGKTWSKIAGDAAVIGRWHNICQGGWTLQNLYDNRAIWSWYLANIPNNGTKTLTVFAGTNDLAVDGISAAACLVRLKTLCQFARTAGFTRIIVITPLPRFQSGTGANTTFEPKRQTFSNDVVADTSGDWDAVIDVRNLAIGVNGNQDTTTNYVNDYIHLNATGEAVLGNAVALIY